MLNTRKGLLLLIILFLITGMGSELVKNFWQPSQSNVLVTEKSRNHILYGDARGGGHLAGTDKPCKSEFPDDWPAEKIVEEVQLIASNDNLNWQRQDNGYYKVERMVEGVRVRVIVNRRIHEVVTAYPVNLRRNPCPAPANDNNP